ncbi:hypothetical protein AB6N26_03315, partial [Escherichia coli]|uniref:hypothetical protein n=1 Tax=Escherichia coli TaxID=562 RepID=UPI003D1D1B61
FCGESAGGFPGRSLHLTGQQKQVIQGRRWRPPVSPRENPWQADACRKGSGPRWRVARYPSRL